MRTLRAILPILCGLLALLSVGSPVFSAETTRSTSSTSEQLRQGERLYREGLLPSGKPAQAFVRGDLPVPGTSFSCVSCHLRSGLGSIEGGVFTPPTNGEKLYKPLQTLYRATEQNPKFFPVTPKRPAYTDETLARVIREGIDPAGRVLNDVMPRYLLDDGDMALLVSYLKSLSAEYSPGVTDSNIHFATVISEDVAPADREAMLAPLQRYIGLKNNNVALFKKPSGARSHLMADTMMSASKELVHKTLSLSVWLLKGPPETWRAQLEEYNRKEPAFALIGGITGGEWAPVHAFSEENRIPCLFPYTDFPVISPTDWYTLYMSKGFYQEGEGAARYLNNRPGLVDTAVLQIVRDTREGRALATGFQQTWRELGHQLPVTVTLKVGEAITAGILSSNAAAGKPAVVLIWDGPSAVAAVETLASTGNAPGMFLVSAGYIGKGIGVLKEQMRDRTYLTYPYRFPKASPAADYRPSNMAMGVKYFSPDTTSIENQTYAIIEVLTMALMDMKGNYYRDNFFDSIGMLMDQEMPLYERISFGPGQRYASKGCYIIQIGPGAKPELIKRSDWVIH
jgi:hypothetical protein